MELDDFGIVLEQVMRCVGDMCLMFKQFVDGNFWRNLDFRFSFGKYVSSKFYCVNLYIFDLFVDIIYWNEKWDSIQQSFEDR